MVKDRKKKGFRKVLSKCLDCGNRFDVEDKECDECCSKNIRQGGWFKVNKTKEQLTEELVNEECLEKIEFDRKLDQMVEDSMVEENLRVEYGPFDNLTKYDD